MKWVSSLCFLIAGERAVAEVRPNVVFFVIDNVNFEHMGKCYDGFGLTPNMDRVAERGVVFDRAYATSPLCIPSRYSCLTGRYASNCTAGKALETNAEDQYWTGEGIELEDNRPNIATVMKAAGYRTGFVGKYHLKHDELPPLLTGDMKKTGQGKFDSKDPAVIANLKAKHEAMRGLIMSRGFDHADRFTCYRSLADTRVDYYDQQHNMEWELESALEFIDQCREEPFMLYWASSMAHLPINVEQLMMNPDALRMTKAGYLPAEQAPRVPMMSRTDIAAGAKNPALSNRENMFRIGMAWLDAAFGALLDRLDAQGRLDNTLIIIFSDNQIAGGKDTVYENGARVPSMIMWNGRIPAGVRSSALVANIDFAPTVFEACKAPFPAATEINGESLLPLLTGKTDQWRSALLLESGYTRALVGERWKYVALRYPDEVQLKIEEWDREGKDLSEYKGLSARSLQFALNAIAALPERVRPLAANPYRWHRSGNNYLKSIEYHPDQFDTDQLYDLNQDADELNNVAVQYPEQVARMKQDLKKSSEQLVRFFGEFSP